MALLDCGRPVAQLKRISLGGTSLISTSRSKALADTLDWLEAQCRLGTVRARIQLHGGATHQGVLSSVTRRDVRLSTDPHETELALSAADIAKVWVSERRLFGLLRPRWVLWFEYEPQRTANESVG